MIAESGCWIWMGVVNPVSGYGQMDINHVVHYPHRISYEEFVGIIPDGKEIDHKCRVRCCVNPHHLEPVTHLENVRRGEAGLVTGAINKSKTQCPIGHEYSNKNTYINSFGRRSCIACRKAASARFYLNKKLSRQ